jgi:hypothetical protein
MYQMLGTPSEETWPGVSLLPNFNNLYFPALLATIFCLNSSAIHDVLPQVNY